MTIADLEFQSTLPVRGATGTIVMDDFSARISIHAPREGSDHHAAFYQYQRSAFQSTLPVRGATPSLTLKDIKNMISIHAPREGSDAL